MSTNSSEVFSGSPETKPAHESKQLKETEKLNPLNWNIIQGDLDKLLAVESYDDYVILERTDASVAQLKKSENPLAKVMQIVLGRIERSKIDPNDTKNFGKHIPSERTTISVFLLLGNGNRRTEKASYDFYHKYFHLVSEYIKVFEESEESESDIIQYFSFDFNSPQNKFEAMQKSQACKDKLNDKDRLETFQAIGFATGDMPAYLVEMLFDTIKKTEILDEEDVQFLKSIPLYRKPSAEELILKEKLEKAFNAGQYKEALEIANALHALSRKGAFERGSASYSIINNVRKLKLLDACDAAFKLGEALEPIAPAEAITAFEIITAYDTNEMSFDAFYETIFLQQAKSKIADIRINLLGTVSDERSARKLRKKAIHSSLLSIGDDPESARHGFKCALNLIETQAGYKNLGSEDRLFDKIDPSMDDPEMISFKFLDIICILADKLYEFKKKASDPIPSAKPLNFTPKKPKATLSLDEEDEVEYEIDETEKAKPKK